MGQLLAWVADDAAALSVGVGALGVRRDPRARDQVGRDKAAGDIIHGNRIIQQSGETAASAAIRSRFQLPARNPDFEGRREKMPRCLDIGRIFL